MIELLDLKGSQKTIIILYGVTDLGTEIECYGYLCRAPKAKREKDKDLPDLPFFQALKAKPLRRGRVFRTEKNGKFKNLDPIEVDVVKIAGINMDSKIRFERIDDAAR